MPAALSKFVTMPLALFHISRCITRLLLPVGVVGFTWGAAAQIQSIPPLVPGSIYYEGALLFNKKCVGSEINAVAGCVVDFMASTPAPGCKGVSIEPIDRSFVCEPRSTCDPLVANCCHSTASSQNFCVYGLGVLEKRDYAGPRCEFGLKWVSL